MNRPSCTFLGFVCSLWAGIVVGVSLLATPVKFEAASLPLHVALEVGRYTFRALERFEWILAAVTLALAFQSRIKGWSLYALGGVGLMMALQQAWLLPALDERVTLVLSGQTPPPSSLHWVFVVLESLKILFLIVVALRTGLRAPEERE